MMNAIFFPTESQMKNYVLLSSGTILPLANRYHYFKDDIKYDGFAATMVGWNDIEGNFLGAVVVATSDFPYDLVTLSYAICSDTKDLEFPLELNDAHILVDKFDIPQSDAIVLISFRKLLNSYYRSRANYYNASVGGGC